MSLLDVRQAIVDTLKAELPTVKTIETHRGRFDGPAEIKRFAVKAPAVLVACLAFPVLNPGAGLQQRRARFGLFVVTRDAPKLDRDAGAIALAEALALAIPDNTWGRDDVSAPSNIDARNLYSGQIDQLGVALWAVSFDQFVTSNAVDETTLAAFETFHQDVDMAPADGQIDISETDTLPQ